MFKALLPSLALQDISLVPRVLCLKVNQTGLELLLRHADSRRCALGDVSQAPQHAALNMLKEKQIAKDYKENQGMLKQSLILTPSSCNLRVLDP
jgi:hypothetical protein